MVVVTGQKPIITSKQGRFRTLDVVDIMRPLTEHTRQIVSGAAIPSSIREAFRLAEEERPGAVHLELPEDIAREETNEPVLQASLARRPAAEDKSVGAAVERIQAARHPLRLVGAAANRPITYRALRQFIRRTGIPFVTTQMGKGVIDEADPLFLGNGALSSHDFVHRTLDCADLIINVGHDVIEKPPFFMTPGGVEVIQVNFFFASVDPVYLPRWRSLAILPTAFGN